MFRKETAYILEKMGVEVDSIPIGRTGNEDILFGLVLNDKGS